jgi:hypothetical protein
MDTLGHILLHIGPGIGMVVILVWAMSRGGQFTNSKRAAGLPLEVAATPDTVVRARRVPIVAIAMAILLGIGIGIPIAAVVIGSRIQVSDAERNGAGEKH